MLGLTRSLISTAALVCRRRIMTSAPLRGDQRSLIKLKQLQSDYQIEDGVPIFLKAGARDKFLYILTLVLCLVGVAGVLEVLYNQAKPASWKNPTC